MSWQEAKSMQGIKPRKVLLIGGAGYIGSVVAGYLLKKGYRVCNFDALLYQTQACILPYLAHENYEFKYGDFTDSSELVEVLHDVTDVIILAGLVGDPITKKYPELSQHINNVGMHVMIDALNGRGLDKVIFISTCSNYGLIGEDVLADENWELKPLSLYAQAKVEIEQKILSLKGRVDYHPVILRFATAFGISPRTRFDLTVNEFVRDLYLGKDLVVYDHETWRPYCHVLDFSLALEQVLLAPNQLVAFEVFNAGSEKNNYTKKMLVDEIKRFIPHAKVTYQQNGSDPRNYRVNFNKIKKVLAFNPRFTVVDGIQELLLALKNNLFTDVEDRPNFYGNYQLHYSVPEIAEV